MDVSAGRASRWLVGLALLLLLVGAGLRFHDLTRMVVWHDEVFTGVRVFGFHHEELLRALFSGRLLTPDALLAFQRPDPGRGWNATLGAIAEHPEHGPLYYLLARLGSHFTDDSRIALRGTSALLSLLLPPALFWLARELFGRGRAPWIALALAAVSPLHLLYAQEARQYALWSALAAAASAAYLRALRRGRGRDWLLYGVFVALGFYTHLLFAVVVAAHALHGLWHLWGDRARLRAALTGWLPAVAGALVAFSPWLVELAWRQQALRDFTAWMSRETTLPKLLAAWAGHLVHPFVDLPGLAPALLLPPLAFAFWRFFRDAPPLARRFVVLLLLLPVAVVVLPDLLLGGRRSLEARYLFPMFLGLELLVAQVLATGMAGRAHRLAAGALGVVLALGLASDLVINRAESWWNKSYSGENAAFARLVNATPRPLVVGSDSSVSAGELVSLAWRLRPEARFLLEPPAGGLALPEGYTALFALLPSETLRRQLEARYRLEPFDDSWKWFVLEPRAPAVVAPPAPR